VGLIVAFYSENVERKAHRFDVLGVFTLGTGVVCLLLGVGGTASWFTVPLSAALLAAFVWVESRAAEPLIPLGLMKRRLFAISNGMGLLLGAVMMGVLLYLPLYAQAVLGSSPTEAGTVITPMMLGWPIASALSGRLLQRFGYQNVIRAGGVLLFAGSLILLLPLDADNAVWLLRLNQLVLGFGLGFANTAAVIAVQDSVEWQERGVATAAMLFSRTIGGALSAGGLGALLAASLLGKVPAGAIDDLLGAAARGGHRVVSEELAAPLHAGMHELFHAIVGVALLAWLSTLAFPQHRARAVESS
jgi:MFS family permease